MTVEINLLGGFSVAGDAAADTPWRLRKAKTLVKLLALTPGHRLHRDVVVEALWPESDPAAGTNNLHQAVHAARKVLGAGRLVLQDDVLVLGPAGDVVVDVEAFDDAAQNAMATGMVDNLRAVVDQWRGDLLPEDLYEDWSTPHRERLQTLRASVVSELAAVYAEDGRADEAVVLLEPLAIERPLDEQIHRSLLVALAAAGRRSDAAAAFDRLRDGLKEEYGVDPERETIAVYRRLFVGGAPDVSADTPHNLPTLSTSFVGRQRQLAELASLLDRTRLLTLTGPGGAGKTRLAVEFSHRQLAAGRRPDGVWLVELAGVPRNEGVPSAVATALGLPLAGGRPWTEALVNQLSSRNLLLVLDNCEHVLDAVVSLTTELLARCPDLVVLTTSREPLGLPAEVAWRVPSLELPSDEFDEDPAALLRMESVQLFVERASDASAALDLDASTAPSVARICRRLDGIPLALELAAARVAHLSVVQLEERLGDALALLTRRGHQLDRQQTIAATLDWSHELLQEDESVAFRRLAVFAGGFDLDAATAVCAMGDVVDVLARLVDKSLVTAETTGSAARYRMLEVVRQYAEARLREAGELAGCRQRHRDWYAAKAAQHDPDRGVAVVLEPSAWFDLEQDNLRAAFVSAVSEEPCVALRLATSSWRFLLSRGQLAEGLRWLSGALDACPEISPLRARALFAKGVLHIRRADLPPVIAIGEEIAEVCRRSADGVAVAAALDQQAIFTLMGHDWPKARALSHAAVVEGDGDAAIVACTAHFSGVLALAVLDGDEAAAHLEAARAALDNVPDDRPPFFTGFTVCWITDDRGPIPLPVGEETMVLGRRVGAAQARGHVAVAAAMAERVAGRVDRALGFIDDAIGRFTALDDRYGLGYALSQRGHTLRWAGEPERGIECFDEAERVRRELGDLRAIAMTLAGRAYLRAMIGDADLARAEAAEACSMMRRTGDLPGVALSVHFAGLIELHLGAMDAAVPFVEEAMEMADRVTPDHAIGWECLLAAYLRASIGDAEASAKAAAEAARRFEKLGDTRGLNALQSACKDAVVMMPS